MAPTVLVATSRQATKKCSLPTEDGTGQMSVGQGSREKYQENREEEEAGQQGRVEAP